MDKTGNIGETYAAEYLHNKGYKIIQRNFRSRFGEIGIIARDDEYLLFVEVKSRSGSFGTAREAVTAQKQRKLITTALIYLKENPTDLQPRFDVVEIYFRSKTDSSLIKLCHIKNAFEAGGTY